MFKKALPIALTFYVSSTQRYNYAPKAYNIDDSPSILRGEMYILTISISAKAFYMPPVDQVKIDVIGAATSKRETFIFYHKEIVLPSDVYCLEVPLQADFPVSSTTRGKYGIQYYATATIKGRGGESTAIAKFQFDLYAQPRVVPHVQTIRGVGYDFVLLCENVVLDANGTLIGRLVAGYASNTQHIRISIQTSDGEGKLQNLGGIELCSCVQSDVAFELPLKGFKIEPTVNWYGLYLQTFLNLEVLKVDGARDYHLTELVIM